MKRIKSSYLFLLIVFPLFLYACRDNEGGMLTIIKGTISNKVTGEPLEGIPVEIWECSGGLNISGPSCDSSMVTYTNASGEYEIAYTSEKGVYYKTGIGRTEEFLSYSITNYGNIIKEGEVNKFDYQSIPFQVLQVEIEVSKKSKNYLQLDIRPMDPEGDIFGSWTLLMDTIQSNSVVDTIIYKKVLPLSSYSIIKNHSNRSGDKPGNYSYEDMEYIHLPKFYKKYEDTTVIKVQ